MNGLDNFVLNFKGTIWNSFENILSVHWKMQFWYNVAILKALDLRARKRFWNAPWSIVTKTSS